LQDADAQRAQFAGLNQGKDIRNAGPAGIDFACQQRIHQTRATAIGDMEKLKPGLLCKDDIVI